MQPHTSYLICATPRSGGTLLCEALTNTGVSGFPRRPAEYFETWDNTEIAELLREYSQFNDESVQPILWDGLNYAD